MQGHVAIWRFPPQPFASLSVISATFHSKRFAQSQGSGRLLLELRKAFFLNPAKLNQTRVARWFVFKPKIPIWVNFGGP
jgi:hypothetical protein